MDHSLAILIKVSFPQVKMYTELQFCFPMLLSPTMLFWIDKKHNFPKPWVFLVEAVYLFSQGNSHFSRNLLGAFFSANNPLAMLN